MQKNSSCFPPHTIALIWVCLLSLAIGQVACRKSHSRDFWLEQRLFFSVSSLELIKKLHLSSATLTQQFWQGLKNNPNIRWFSRKPGTTPPKQGYTIHLEWGMLPLPPDVQQKKVRLQWYVQYRLQPVDAEQEVLTLQESKDHSYTLAEKLPKREDVAALYLQLWGQGIRSLAAFGKLRNLSGATLLPYLQQNSLQLRRHATLFLGQKRYKPAIPLLLKQLNTQDRDLLLATVGALVKLRSREAAVPLIQLARQKDGPFLAQILSALGEIGGEEAKSFLFTIASSHDNKAVKETAQEALDELQQRESTKKPQPLSQRKTP